MDPKQLQTTLEDLESDVERLKALYQQYFMGIEKMPPAVLRKRVERTLWQLRRERIPAASTRFKFQQISQRFGTYEQLWGRILRQIETGTYKRDVIRAAKLVGNDAAKAALGKAFSGQEIERAIDRGRQQPTEWDIADPPTLDEDDDARTPPSMRVAYPAQPAPWEARSVPAGTTPRAAPGYPAAPGQPQPGYPPAPLQPQPGYPPAPLQPQRGYPAAPGAYAPPPSPFGPPLPPPMAARPLPPQRSATPPSTGNSPTEMRTRQIYNDYVDARRRAGEPTDGITYERLSKTLSDQTAKLRAQHPTRGLDYEVVQKDGKPVIRPVVK